MKSNNNFEFLNLNFNQSTDAVALFAIILLVVSVIATLMRKSKKEISQTSGDSMLPTIPNPGLVETDENYYKDFQPRIGHIVGVKFNPNWTQDYINTSFFYYEMILKRKLQDSEKEYAAKNIYNDAVVVGQAYLGKRIKAVPFNKISFKNNYLYIDNSNMHYHHKFYDFEQEHILRLTNNSVIPQNYCLVLSDNADVKDGFLLDSRVFGLVHFGQLIQRTTKLLKKTDKGEIKVEKYFA